MSHLAVDQASKQNLVVDIQDSEFGKLVVRWRERDKRHKIFNLLIGSSKIHSCFHDIFSDRYQFIWILVRHLNAAVDFVSKVKIYAKKVCGYIWVHVIYLVSMLQICDQCPRHRINWSSCMSKFEYLFWFWFFFNWLFWPVKTICKKIKTDIQ